MDKNKKLGLGIVIGVIIGVITLFALLIVLFLFFLFGGSPKIVEDISQYEELISLDEANKGLLVFPLKLPESATNTDFYYSIQDTWDDPKVELFLQCDYSKEDFESEIERLENTKKQYGSVVRTLKRDGENRYPYEAYIAVDNDYYEYEYALLTGDSQITYIMLAYISEGSLKKVDKRYLPYHYKEEHEKGKRGYNIYLSNEDVKNGEVVSWSLDHTRDEIVEVAVYHPVSVGYNYFTVGTVADEMDTPIIKEVSYVYYKNSYDALFGLPQKIEYHELDGCVFENIELSADKDKVRIAYYEYDSDADGNYEGKEKKVMEYGIPETGNQD